jgi:hypothetical protein
MPAAPLWGIRPQKRCGLSESLEKPDREWI